MADNYLEKRYEEVFGAGASRKVPVKHASPALNTLLVRNRTIRRYRQDYKVTDAQLRTIVEVNTKIASAMNRQALRFRIVPTEDTAMLEALKTCLFREQPARSEAATAFIVVFTAVPEDRFIDIDLGISLQSMALKAAELGLNCLIKGNIDRLALKSLFSADAKSETHDASKVEHMTEKQPLSAVPCHLEPLAVLCMGKAAESVFLKPMSGTCPPHDEDLVPYTRDGVHYVPKLQIDSLLV